MFFKLKKLFNQFIICASSSQELIEYLIDKEELKLVDNKKNLERKCFMIDPHCTNVLMFHYSLRDKIMNHEFTKTFKLIAQVNT